MIFFFLVDFRVFHTEYESGALNIEIINRHIYIFYLEERRQPWIYGGSGLLIGCVIVLADQFLTDKPSIQVDISIVFIFNVYSWLKKNTLHVKHGIYQGFLIVIIILNLALFKKPFVLSGNHHLCNNISFF